MPKVYICYDNDGETPFVAKKIDQIMKARKHLPHAKNIRVMELSVDGYNGTVQGPVYATIQNYALTEKKRIQEELETLRLKRQEHTEKEAALNAELAKLPQ